MIEHRIRSKAGSAGADEPETIALWASLLIEQGAKQLQVEHYDDSLPMRRRRVRVDAELSRQARALLRAARTLWRTLKA